MKTQRTINGPGSLGSALCLGVALLSFLGTQDVQAFPPDAINTANSCRTCHGIVGGGRQPSGLIDITGVRTVNLPAGVDLDGTIRGPLATFDGVPGSTVTLAVDILASTNLGPNPRASIQLKRLETPGQQNSLQNFLSWSNANPAESGWVIHGTNTVRPYFTKDLSSGEFGTFTFDLGLNPSTPVDLYDLEFAIAGVDGPAGVPSSLYYGDEHFYVAVVSATLFTDSAVTFSAALANAGYVLEVATNVNGPWTTYTGPTSTMEGSRVVLMKTSEGPRKYFRLRKL